MGGLGEKLNKNSPAAKNTYRFDIQSQAVNSSYPRMNPPATQYSLWRRLLASNFVRVNMNLSFPSSGQRGVDDPKWNLRKAKIKLKLVYLTCWYVLLLIDHYLYKPVLDALCLTLSDAIRNGSEERAVELVKQVTAKKLALSIKLKNPVFVTMDAGLDSIK